MTENQMNRNMIKCDGRIRAVLAVVGGLAIAACDNRDLLEEKSRLEVRLGESEDQIRELNKRIDTVLGDLSEAEKELSRAREAAEALEEAKAESEAKGREIDELKEALEALRQEFDGYREKYSERKRSELRGRRLERLELADGAVHLNVTVREISEDAMSVIAETGILRVEASQLADPRQFGMEKIESAGAGEAVAGSTESDGGWRPRSVDDVAECALLVWMDVDRDGDPDAAGSAFFVNEMGKTYIYTNMHNLAEVPAFELEDVHGTRYPMSCIVGVEAVRAPFGTLKDKRGGDLLRLQFHQYREKALRIDPSVRQAKDWVGRQIIVCGNTGGRGAITRLPGVVTDVTEGGVMEHTAATEGGNSGSPIVDAETLEVVGILTWGITLPGPLEFIWKQIPITERRGTKYGALLAGATFEKTSFQGIRRNYERLLTLKQYIHVLGVLETIEPSHEGLFRNPDARVLGGEYTVREILKETSNTRMTQALVALHRKLESRKDKGTKFSNIDVMKFYLGAMRSAHESVVSYRKMIESNADWLYYYKALRDHLMLCEVSRAYERELARLMQWYSRNLAVGAKTPVAERVRLPQFSAGLAGLGLAAREATSAD